VSTSFISRAGSCLLLASVSFSLLTDARGQDRGFYVETPFVHQVQNYCGPAALTMVFRYWGRSVDQYALAERFRPFPKKGLSGAQLKDLAAEYGFSAYSFSGEPDEILDHLRNGHPIIVALHSQGPLNFNHFVVVVGWDPAKKDWIVQDPAGKSYERISAQAFRDRWGKLDNWSLLIVPRKP